MAGQPHRDDNPRRHVDGLKEPQRQFRVMEVLLGSVRQFLHIEIGENPQQCRTHIDPAAQPDFGETLQAGQARRFHQA